MRNLDVLAAILLVVGGLNWGLVGLADYIFSSMPTVEKTIYGLVGLAAVYQIIGLKGIRTRWNVK